MRSFVAGWEPETREAGLALVATSWIPRISSVTTSQVRLASHGFSTNLTPKLVCQSESNSWVMSLEFKIWTQIRLAVTLHRKQQHREIYNTWYGFEKKKKKKKKKKIDPQSLGCTSFMLNSISARSGIHNAYPCIPCKWNGTLSYGYWNQYLSWKYFVVLDRSIGGIRRLMCSPQIRFRQPSHSSNSTLLSELHLFNYHLPKWSCLLF